MKYIKLFERFNKSGENIWYHITTEENWKSIKKDGKLKPKTIDYMGTIIFKDKSEADNIIKYPTWVIRDTISYVLLEIDVQDDAVSDQGVKHVKETETGQARVKKDISTSRILSITPIKKVKAKILSLFRKNDMLIGFVKVGFTHPSYNGNKHPIILFCRWDDKKDHFGEEKYFKEFNKHLKKSIDEMVMDKSEMDLCISDLIKINFKESDEKIIIPF